MAGATGTEWFSSVRIKVSPEYLKQKASELQIQISNIQGEFDSLEQKINAMPAYWSGRANEAYIERYEKYKPKMEEIIQRLREHVVDLNLMADNYLGVENTAKTIIEDLPGDVIV